MRYWSVLFALAGVTSVACFLYAPLDAEWWLPGYASTNSAYIDQLKGVSSEAKGLSRTLEALPASAADDPKRLAVLDDARKTLELGQSRVEAIATAGFLPTRAKGWSDQLALARRSLDELRAGGDARPSAKLVSDLAASIDEGLATTDGADLTISSAGANVDGLTILILGITGLVFLVTITALAWSCFRYASVPGRSVTYTHGSLKLEIAWTLIPAVVLVFLAFYQMKTWADIKFVSRRPVDRPLAEVTAKQFQWTIRYAGADETLGTVDDLYTANDLHFVKSKPVVINLRSDDVIHSFYLPQFRIKQDAVPGWTIPVWFDASRAGVYELVCAELCGWGHYKMRARVVVHETDEEFKSWMAEALQEQNRDQSAAATSADSTGG